MTYEMFKKMLLTVYFSNLWTISVFLNHPMFYINVINWNISATYQNIIRICDREGCFLEISAICWSNGQSHS